mmetsp:Transcript_20657/g.29034  ORF Transcript_20657/g.29034 Transcript_20657/m.29034 type:complete len:102 (+) Transcript_20657:323-628(+)
MMLFLHRRLRLPHPPMLLLPNPRLTLPGLVRMLGPWSLLRMATAIRRMMTMILRIRFKERAQRCKEIHDSREDYAERHTKLIKRQLCVNVQVLLHAFLCQS